MTADKILNSKLCSNKGDLKITEKKVSKIISDLQDLVITSEHSFNNKIYHIFMHSNSENRNLFLNTSFSADNDNTDARVITIPGHFFFKNQMS